MSFPALSQRMGNRLFAGIEYCVEEPLHIKSAKYGLFRYMYPVYVRQFFPIKESMASIRNMNVFNTCGRQLQVHLRKPARFRRLLVRRCHLSGGTVELWNGSFI